MFHEYRKEISELKVSNNRFAKIFEYHNELDQKAKDADEGRLALSDAEISEIKRKKLALKDEALMLIKEYIKNKES